MPTIVTPDRRLARTKPPRGSRLRPGVRPELVAHWLLNEYGGGTAYDLVGSSPAAATNGALIGPDGVFVTDSNHSYLNAGASTRWDLQSHSVILRFKGDNFNRHNILLAREAITSDGYEWAVRDPGKLGFAYYDGGIRGWYEDSGTTLVAGTWYNVVLVFDATAGQIRFYVEGALSSTQSATTGTIVHNPARELWIGNRSFVDNENFIGYFSEVAIANRAYSTEEVRELYRHPYAHVQPPNHRRTFTVAGGGGTGVTHNASVIAAVLTAPARTVTTGATVAANTLTAALTAPARTVATGAAVTANTLGVTLSAPSRTVTTGATVSASTQARTLSAIACTVNTTGGTTAAVNTLGLTLGVVPYTVQTAAAVTAGTATATITAPARTVSGGATFTANTLSLTLSPVACTATSGPHAMVPVSTLLMSVSIFAPLITAVNTSTPQPPALPEGIGQLARHWQRIGTPSDRRIQRSTGRDPRKHPSEFH